MAQLDILIPHFNDIDGLKLALDSVAKQTWLGDKRVVICDDGSSEQVYKQIHLLLDTYTRIEEIELIRNTANKGRPYTRNVLLDALESPYCAWLDSGDEWYEGKVGSQFDRIHRLQYTEKSTKNMWVTCNYHWIWIGGAAKLRKQNTSHDQVKSLLVGSSLRAYLWTFLGESSSFKQVGWFDERLPRMQDLDFTIRFVKMGGRIHPALSPEALCAYYKTDSGKSSQLVYLSGKALMKKHRMTYRTYGKRFMKMRKYNHLMHVYRFSYNNKDIRDSAYYLIIAFLTKPLKLLEKLWKSRLRP